MRHLLAQLHKSRFLVATCGLFLACCMVVLLLTMHVEKKTPIDEGTFPDEVLRAYMRENIDIDQDGQISMHEAGKLISLELEGVQNLEGLSCFYNLREIHVSDDELLSADLSGLDSLSIVNLSGSSNLEHLTLGGNGALQGLYVAGTAIKELNLSGLSALTKLSCDRGVLVSGAPGVYADLVTSYHADLIDAEGASSTLDVAAEYDESNRLLSRELSGVIDATICYEYDEFGNATEVSVVSPDGARDAVWTVTYEGNELALRASSSNGDFFLRDYDQFGRPTHFEIDAQGAKGRVTTALDFFYDELGMLSRIVQAGDSDETYYVGYDSAGSLVSLTSQGRCYSYGQYVKAPNGQYVRFGPLAEHDDDTYLSREYLVSGRDGELVEVVADPNGSMLRETLGSYRYDDAGWLAYGSATSIQTGESIEFTTDCLSTTVPVNCLDAGISAIDLTCLTSPGIAIDYFLPGDAEWVLEQEVQRIVSAQDVSRAFSAQGEYYNAAELKASNDIFLVHIDELLANYSESEGDLACGFRDIDGDSSSELVIARGERTDDVVAIYTLVDETPVLSRSAAAGERLCLSGSRYLVATTQDGTASLERYNGVRFDRLQQYGADEGDQAALTRYTPLSGIDWQG